MPNDIFKIITADHIISAGNDEVVVNVGEVVYIRPLEMFLKRVVGPSCMLCPFDSYSMRAYCKSIYIPGSGTCCMTEVKDGS